MEVIAGLRRNVLIGFNNDRKGRKIFYIKGENVVFYSGVIYVIPFITI